MFTVAAALAGSSLPVFLVSALAPAIQADLGFGEASLGATVAAFFLAAAVSSVPGGRFADRFGAPTALRTGLLITVIGGGGVALFADTAPTLAAAMFFAGTALGFVDTGGARAIAAAVPSDRQGLAFGSKEASIPTASFLAGASVPLLAAQVGWRPNFIVAAAIAAGIALLVSARLEGTRGSTTPPPPPAVAASPESRTVHGRMTKVSKRDDASATGGASTAEGARSLPLLLLALTAGLGGGAAAATTAFLVASTAAGGLTPATAGALLAGASAVAIVVRLAVGAAADRHPGAVLRLIVTLLMIGAVGVACLAVGMAMDPSWGVYVRLTLGFGALLGVGAGWGCTGLMFLAAVRLDASRPAKAAGVVLAGLGVGGAAGPIVLGAIAGRIGYVSAWSVTAAVMFAASVLALFAHRLAQQQRGAELRP